MKSRPLVFVSVTVIANVTRVAIGLVMVGGSVVLAGCGASAAPSLKANALMVQRESTPDILMGRGDAFASVGDSTRAEQYFAAALAGGGDSSQLTRRLIRVCVSDQRFHSAILYAENHLRRFPSDYAVRFVLATVLAGIGDTAAAQQNLELLARETPEDADVHFALAVLLRESGHDALGADKEFRLYLKYAPGGVNAAHAQASLLKFKGVKR
jgi:predicted Zn-dependent protease